MAIPSCQVWLGEETVIDGAVTWVDITAYVRFESAITRSVGKSYGGGAQPGTASLTLENTDSRFTVGNVSSPYYPYVHLQSLIKIWRDGRPFFVGRIQSMPMSWPTAGDNQCNVTVSLADKMARYERIVLDAFAVEEILSLSPSAYWPMVESSGSPACNNKVATSGPLLLSTPGDGTVAFGSGAGPAGDGRSVAQFTAGTVPARLASNATPFDTITSQSVSICAAFSTTVGGLIAWIGSDITTIYWDVYVQVSTYLGAPGIITQASSGGSESFFPVSNVMDGNVHTVTFVVGAATASHVACYVDGVFITPTLIPPVSYFSSHQMTVQLGAASVIHGSVPFSNFTGSIGHVALWPRAVTAAEAAQIGAALLGTTLTTQNAFLKMLGWRGQAASALIDAGATDGITSGQIGGGSLASELNALNDSEAGTLYVDSQDRLTWKSRRTGLSPTLSLTADDITAPTYNCEMQGIVTKVTATQLGITTIVLATDYNTIGEISGSVTSISNADGDGAGHASALANSAPRGPFIGSLQLDLATMQSTPFAAAITGGILAGVTLTGMPSQTPPGSAVLEVIGEQESFSKSNWDLTWTTVPAGTGSARDLLITDDATYGVTDSTHRVAY